MKITKLIILMKNGDYWGFKMLNAEKYKGELKKLNDADKLWCSAFDKHNMTFDSCLNVKCENCAFNCGKGCDNGRYNWLLSEYIEHIDVSEFEYNILKYLADETKYMYIARDKKGSLYLYDFEHCNSNTENWWIGKGATQLTPFNKLFKFITWEDDKPTSIKDILDNCIIK